MIEQKKDNIFTISWNPSDIYDNEVEYRMEEEKMSSEDAQDFVQSYFDITLEEQWSDLCDYLTEVIDKMNPSNLWFAKVENFGWQKQYGTKHFTADNGQEFLKNILPETECVFTIYVDDEQKLIKINNFHHDSCDGSEWYYISIDKGE